MKKLLWCLGILTCFVSGCTKSPNYNTTCNYTEVSVVAPNNEIDSVQKYLNLHNITATEHSSGVFYSIITEGTGDGIVNLCSNVTVKYTGKLTNGTVFDSTGTGTLTLQLGQVITGWQQCLPLIIKGGKITLYIPPTLGYGDMDQKNSAGVVVVPANSILIFDIEIIDIN